ncbi:DUF502 domain-containing protein [Natrinema altunense]|uniref:DUF502 domain-containing protein n=1 Tax=Natrinema altunense (strain JCM 12890 / CGMCC 1.3731 / AJ2) TaxID=1227494 RepID=L9ZM44_NATA2|nr:DUF502 domain-containing protein [Natrinema altunense]ELY87434.1 hypothetical protein C485_06895 [Natrinema altunense JCM 12890]
MTPWKRVFASGLILIGPILVTLYVVYRAYALAIGFTPAGMLGPEMLAGFIGHEPTRVLIVRVLQLVVSLGSIVLIAIAIGTLTRTTVGDVFTRSVDGIANRVPGLRVVYNASKVAAETTLGEEQALQEPVKVRSWDGTQMPAFKTGHTTSDGRVVLFVPTSPNVSSGFVVEADADRVIETDDTVEETLARVLSGGFGDSTHPQRHTESPLGPSEDRSTDEE